MNKKHDLINNFINSNSFLSEEVERQKITDENQDFISDFFEEIKHYINDFHCNGLNFMYPLSDKEVLAMKIDVDTTIIKMYYSICSYNGILDKMYYVANDYKTKKDDQDKLIYFWKKLIVKNDSDLIHFMKIIMNIIQTKTIVKS